MLVEILKPDFVFEDDRGSLRQLVHDDYKQINVSTSKKGVFRGGHYHKCNKEAFYIVSGSLKLELKSNNQREDYIFKSGDFFVIKENISHGLSFLEDTTLVIMYSNGVEIDENAKDIYADD